MCKRLHETSHRVQSGVLATSWPEVNLIRFCVRRKAVPRQDILSLPTARTRVGYVAGVCPLVPDQCITVGVQEPGVILSVPQQVTHSLKPIDRLVLGGSRNRLVPESNNPFFPAFHCRSFRPGRRCQRRTETGLELPQQLFSDLHGFPRIPVISVLPLLKIHRTRKEFQRPLWPHLGGDTLSKKRIAFVPVHPLVETVQLSVAQHTRVFLGKLKKGFGITHRPLHALKTLYARRQKIVLALCLVLKRINSSLVGK